MIIRPTTQADIAPLQAVLASAELFPPEQLPDMLQRSLDKPDCADIWLTGIVDDKVAGFCYTVPETLTNGTWNMLAIAVARASQRSGLGSAMVAAVEAELLQRGQRVLIIDTSSSATYASARSFYRRNGYHQAAVIPSFWDDGDDKITFYKALRTS